MSPRRPHLRNRKKIKLPTRFEDADYMTSPRQEAHEETDESSELEEETYKSPKPKKPKPKRPAYRGKVTEFNPNLPPASFPTLDHPDYVHNGGTVAVDLVPQSLGSQSQEVNDNAFSLERGSHPEKFNLTEDLPTMTSATVNFTRRGSQRAMQTSITVQKQSQGSTLSSMHGEATDNGPRNPIWASDMAWMEEAGRMSDLDRIVREMETSGEEDAATGPSKLAKSSEFPAWDDLNIAHKLDLADAIAELYPDLPQVMHQLRLGVSQKEELVELLSQRQDRAAREEANQRRLQEQTQDVLLQGRRLSQSEFHQMVEENLYGDISEDDHLQTNLMELKKARAYLRYCGLDPRLADRSWDVPSISNAASGTKPRPAQSKPKANFSNTATRTPSSPSEGPSSRRLALSTPSQKVSHPPGMHPELAQQHLRGAPPQHRPTPALALIAQHSPAAPLDKVPVQSYRVASSSQSGGLRAKPHGRARIPPPSFSAGQVQPNASTGTDRGITNSALPRLNGAFLNSSSPQEEHPLLGESRPLAPKGLPAPRGSRKRQSSANASAGASAPQGNGRIVGNGDLVDKKKRKQSAT